MIRLIAVLVLLLLMSGVSQPLTARPEFLARFQGDPMRRSTVDGCSTCHIDPKGGGPRNEFGLAFREANFTVTPLLRASFPSNFGFHSTRLADGSAFYFSDPENKVVVFERDNKKVLIDLVALTVEKKKEDPIPPAANRMTFFVTSAGPGKGGHLEGIAGADRHCQALAEKAGAGDRIWRAYLSTSFDNKAGINAGDRIGAGPWYNAKNVLIARGVADLHKSAPITPETALDEKGEPAQGAIMTGSLPDGTAAVGQTCNNWTSSDAGAASIAGNGHWNSGDSSKSCRQEDLGPNGGLFYCFARR